MLRRKSLVSFVVCVSLVLFAMSVCLANNAIAKEEGFGAIVLGSGGGPREDDISGIMLWPTGAPEEAIIFDPGVLTVGIRKAEEMGNLWDFQVPAESNLTREGWVLRNTKAYLGISPSLGSLSSFSYQLSGGFCKRTVRFRFHDRCVPRSFVQLDYLAQLWQ